MFGMGRDMMGLYEQTGVWVALPNLAAKQS